MGGVATGSMRLVDDTIDDWTTRKTSLRCDEIQDRLRDLGFKLRPRTAGHVTITHPLLEDFHGASFDCGHGRNNVIKLGYVVKIIRLLRTYQDDLP
jgi:hypothetical protein